MVKIKMKIKLLKSSPTPQCHKTCYTLPKPPNQSRGNFEVLEIKRFVTNLYYQKLFFLFFLLFFLFLFLERSRLFLCLSSKLFDVFCES